MLGAGNWVQDIKKKSCTRSIPSLGSTKQNTCIICSHPLHLWMSWSSYTLKSLPWKYCAHAPEISFYLKLRYFVITVLLRYYYGISGAYSVLHCASCTAHKNNVIGRISARVFRERGIAFQSMDQVKRWDGLSLWNEHDDHYFYCIISVNKLFPLNWRNLENIQPLIQRKTRQFPKRIFIYPDVRRRLLCRAWRRVGVNPTWRSCADM